MKNVNLYENVIQEDNTVNFQTRGGMIKKVETSVPLV